MSRLIIFTLAVLMLSGCSVIKRVDMTIERLDTANGLLLTTTQQMASVSKQMAETQASSSSQIASSSNRPDRSVKASRSSPNPARKLIHQTKIWYSRTKI